MQLRDIAGSLPAALIDVGSGGSFMPAFHHNATPSRNLPPPSHLPRRCRPHRHSLRQEFKSMNNDA
jgi:hypothetical protein